MRNIKVITDSCADLDLNLLEKYDLDYAKMNTVCDGVTTPASLTWEAFTPAEFYNLMRDGKRITTTQVMVEEFQRIFTKYVEEGYDILYIGCSSKLSGSVNTGSLVAKKMMEENPDIKIICIDSINASIGIGMLAMKASEMVKEGLDIDTIAEKITAMRNNVRQFVTVHSLDTLKRSGRVKGSTAFFGNLLGVKPIFICDAEGYNVPIKKVKGRGASLKELVALLKESIIDPEEQTVYILGADCAESELEQFRALIRAEINCKDIYTLTLGPIIGASCGPDTVAIFGFGKEVTLVNGD